MAMSASPQHLYWQDWSPGFTRPYPPAGNARGLEMANAAKPSSSAQRSKSAVIPDLLGICNRPFRLPNGYGMATAELVGSSASHESRNPQAINPELLRPGEQQSTEECPISTLRSVCRELYNSKIDYDGQATAVGRRGESEAEVGFQSGHSTLVPSSSSQGLSLGLGDRKRRRILIWSRESNSKRYEHEAKERESEEFEVEEPGDKWETSQLELSPTKGNKRERRQMQNKLAQRAFRGLSKVRNQEVANHLSRLETLAKTQAERLTELTALVERIQRENTSIKKGRWSSLHDGNGRPDTQ